MFFKMREFFLFVVKFYHEAEHVILHWYLFSKGGTRLTLTPKSRPQECQCLIWCVYFSVLKTLYVN